MSEVYSKTPPTEPGWYWIVIYEGSVIGELRHDSEGKLHWSVNSRRLDQDVSWYGPRIPAAAEMAAIHADQVRLTWLFRTVLQAWPREKIDAQMSRDAELLQACNEEYDTDEDFMDHECP